MSRSKHNRAVTHGYWPHSDPNIGGQDEPPVDDPAVIDQTHRKERDRDELLIRLAQDVHELTGVVETHVRVQRDRVDGKWKPSEPKETRLPSLLVQLELVRGAIAGPDETGRSQPSSRTPPGSQAAELLADIDAGVRRLLVQVQEDLDVVRRKHPSHRPARHTPQPPTGRHAVLRAQATARIIRLLADLARTAPETTSDRICKSVHSWANSARVTLSYLAPMVTLEAVCRYCSASKVGKDGRKVGTSLIVRADASSDVICVTDGCVDENGDTPRWQRGAWTFLLDQVIEGA